MKKCATRTLSVLLVLAMVFSMLAVSVSGASLDLSEIAANEDANLGLSYDVQDVISISEDQHHSIKIEVSGKSVDELNKAIADGSIKLSLDRDVTRPYLDSTLYPNAIAGGDMTDTSIWATERRKALFTDIAMTAAAEEGKTVLQVEFDSNCYFYYSRPNPYYSVPPYDGGIYLDFCGWFKLTASAGEEALGSADLKITPYESFHTMPEIYSGIDKIVALANENGLYAVKKSMGLSTAGRDMPYMIIADSEASVNAWLELTEKAQTDPTAVLSSIEKGEWNGVRVPVLYSSLHGNEVAAADGIMQFAWALAEAGIDGKFTYDSLTGFTPEGEAQLKKEMNDPSRCYANYDGLGTGVAVPDLVKDTATYLGYLQDGNGKSGVVDLDNYYTREEKEVSVKDLLSGVFYILVPEENVDGRSYFTGASSDGYDLNYDNAFQNTPETANMQRLIGTYNPVSFTEFHGQVDGFLCEPCTPPHEPNYEYDLLAEHLLPGGEAFGIAAVANNDSYNSYVIPQRDYLSYTDEEKTKTQWLGSWDDMSTGSTPRFAMLHGTAACTVELPAHNEDAVTALRYGIIGQSDYINAEKLSYLKAQTKIFQRGISNFNSNAFELVGQWFCDRYDVEGAEMDLFRPEYDGEGENGNFYPECYIIPMDGAMQRNVQAAADMMVWLARNDVKVHVANAPFAYEGVRYPEGTMIVSMYQAKRSVANSVLYDGTLINTWPALNSERCAETSNFSELRGFDMVTVTEPAAFGEIAAVLGEEMDYEEALKYAAGFKPYFVGEKNADVIICNDSEVSAAAVNALLQAGKNVAMITGGNYKGDFICAYEDYLSIADDYLISAIGVYGEDIEAKLIEKAPTVYITGIPGPVPRGCIASAQVGYENWNYDRCAMERMNFKVTEDAAEADVFAGATDIYGDALNAVLAGAPYICYGAEAASGGFDYINLPLFIPNLTRISLTGTVDFLTYVTYPNETLVNCSYIAEGDDVMYGGGIGYSFGYFSSIPEDAVALVQVDGSHLPIQGYVSTSSEVYKKNFENFLNGGILGFSYKTDKLNIAMFANSLTHMGHQRDEYAYISNFIFSSLLSDEDYADAGATDTDHKYDKVVTAPTCTEGGYTTYTCSKCGDSYVADEVAAIGHKYEEAATKPTCTKGGYTTFTCSVCKDTYMGAEVEAVGHKWDDGKVTTEATEKAEGIMTYTCSVCQEIRTKGIPTLECASKSFSDVPAFGNWAHEGIDYCVDNKLMNGTGEGLFNPKGTLTRAELVTILYRAKGEPEVEFKGVFADVADNKWYSNAIEWAAANKIVNGIGNNKFNPTDIITREQIATMLYRYAGEPEITGNLASFSDADTVSEFAQNAMIWATANKIITGTSAGGLVTLAPKADATREQIAAIVMRYLKAK